MDIEQAKNIHSKVKEKIIQAICDINGSMSNNSKNQSSSEDFSDSSYEESEESEVSLEEQKSTYT